jgi:hypothetical protein
MTLSASIASAILRRGRSLRRLGRSARIPFEIPHLGCDNVT